MALSVTSAPTGPPGAGPEQLTALGSGGWYVGLLATFPVAWALGLGPFVWLLVPVAMAPAIARSPTIVVPRGTAVWGCFLAVMAVSVVQVDQPGSLAVFAMRAGWYLGATVTLLYLVNEPSHHTPVRVARAGIALWAAAVALGWLALLAPSLAWTGPGAALLPDAIASTGFVSDLTSPRLAEVQRVGDLTLGRPAAPFPYTNSWGSTVALLTPLVVAAWSDRRLGLRRGLVVALLVAMVPPFVLSLNRGAWLTLAIGLAVGAGRLLAGRWRTVAVVLVLTGAGAALAGATGVLSPLAEQLETRTADSDEARSSLYAEAFTQTRASPLLGHGTPRPSTVLPDGPPVGTHGQLWMVLYSHGFVAAALFVGFFVGAHHSARDPRTPLAFWARVALLVGLAQLPIYGHLPHQLFVMMGLVAIMHVERRHRAEVPVAC